jgi:hypothetical protein
MLGADLLQMQASVPRWLRLEGGRLGSECPPSIRWASERRRRGREQLRSKGRRQWQAENAEQSEDDAGSRGVPAGGGGEGGGSTSAERRRRERPSEQEGVGTLEGKQNVGLLSGHVDVGQHEKKNHKKKKKAQSTKP